jgi:hypothetical protein
MPLKWKYDNEDDIPEEVKHLYREVDGTWFLDTAEKLLPETEVTGLISKRDELLGEVKKLKTRYKDVDPDKYTELLAAEKKLREFEETGGNKLEDIEAKVKEREERLLSKHAQEIEALSNQLKGTERHIQELMVDSAATTALTKAQAKAKHMRLLGREIRERVALTKNDSGGYDVNVVDENGDIRITSKPGSTAKMSIEELAAEMRDLDEFSPLFEPDGKSGGGATGSTGGGGGAFTFSREELRDPATYRKAHEEAAKAGAEIKVRD